jgi:CheY-like chemotaxis protein
MAKTGPIILIEDDPDDKAIFEDAIHELGVSNALRAFDSPIECFKYLKTTHEQPFLIFCDVNLPRQNGLDFKASIDGDPQLRRKSIPFIFYSTSVNQETVNRAYLQLTVQGFFKKANYYEEIKSMLKLIMDYWIICKHPNSV